MWKTIQHFVQTQRVSHILLALFLAVGLLTFTGFSAVPQASAHTLLSPQPISMESSAPMCQHVMDKDDMQLCAHTCQHMMNKDNMLPCARVCQHTVDKDDMQSCARMCQHMMAEVA